MKLVFYGWLIGLSRLMGDFISFDGIEVKFSRKSQGHANPGSSEYLGNVSNTIVTKTNSTFNYFVYDFIFIIINKNNCSEVP